MKLSFPGLLLFVAGFVCASSPEVVRADIADIKTLLETLQSDAQKVIPGLLGVSAALQVQVDAVAASEKLIQAAADAEDSPPFGSSSLSVGLDLIGLEPVADKTLQAIEDKVDTFGQLGLIVLASLYQLLDDTIGFSDKVIEKLGPLEKAIAPGVVASIRGNFNDAITAYGGKGEQTVLHVLSTIANRIQPKSSSSASLCISTCCWSHGQRDVCSRS